VEDASMLSRTHASHVGALGRAGTMNSSALYSIHEIMYCLFLSPEIPLQISINCDNRDLTGSGSIKSPDRHPVPASEWNRMIPMRPPASVSGSNTSS